MARRKHLKYVPGEEDSGKSKDMQELARNELRATTKKFKRITRN